jgi:hypothetical protein
MFAGQRLKQYSPFLAPRHTLSWSYAKRNTAATSVPSRSMPAIPSAFFSVSCVWLLTSNLWPPNHCSCVQRLGHPALRRRVKTSASGCAWLNPGFYCADSRRARFFTVPESQPIVFSGTVFDRRTEAKLWSQCWQRALLTSLSRCLRTSVRHPFFGCL